MSARNPFEADNDDDNYYRNPALSGRNNEINYYEQQIDSTLNKTLESTKNSLRYLEESEQIGIATAEDLVNQGEKLKKADRTLDEMQATTKETQRHLTGIKSVFGGLKNYFSKAPPKKDQSQAAPDTEDCAMKSSKSMGKLEKTVGNLRGDGDQEQPQGSSSSYMTTSQSMGGSLSTNSSAALKGTKWEAMDDEVDQNIDLMSDHLRRIRDLGKALGEEIDSQNQLIDRIAVKADKTDTVIRDQDKQMKRILGGAPKKGDKEKGETSSTGKSK